MALGIELAPRPPTRQVQEAALEARRVSKSFPTLGRAPQSARAVDDVSLIVRRGEIYGLLGANGSGKSTLIRVFSALLEADAGEVRVFGHDVRREELAVKRSINRVSVDAPIFKKLSVMDNLVCAGRIYGVTPDDSPARARSILSRLGIEEDRFGQPLERLSRGIQQKVSIARAFLTAPVLLLLDEPTTGLDIRSKREVQTLIRDLRDEHDATILLTTHDLDEAQRLADRLGVLHAGRLVAEGSCDELSARFGGATLEDLFMTVTGRKIGDADRPEPAE